MFLRLNLGCWFNHSIFGAERSRKIQENDKDSGGIVGIYLFFAPAERTGRPINQTQKCCERVCCNFYIIHTIIIWPLQTWLKMWINGSKRGWILEYFRAVLEKWIYPVYCSVGFRSGGILRFNRVLEAEKHYCLSNVYLFFWRGRNFELSLL